MAVTVGTRAHKAGPWKPPSVCCLQFHQELSIPLAYDSIKVKIPLKEFLFLTPGNESFWLTLVSSARNIFPQFL